jgi:hypothetical protein
VAEDVIIRLLYFCYRSETAQDRSRTPQTEGGICPV